MINTFDKGNPALFLRVPFVTGILVVLDSDDSKDKDIRYEYC